MNATLSDKMKMPSKYPEDSRFPSEIHSYKSPAPHLILKHAVLMFIQRSQTTQINQYMGNTGNVYRNIGNVFKNHITVIEKNYIAIHINIELLSSPNYRVKFKL